MGEMSISGGIPRNCPFCAEVIGANVLSCPHCQSSFREMRRPKRILRMYRPSLSWERWGVLGLLGIGLLGQFYSHLTGEGSVVGTALSLLMFVGIYTRSTWGWWLTNILCGLNTLLLIGFGSMLTGGEGVVLYTAAFINGLIIALLLLSRLRGTYD